MSNTHWDIKGADSIRRIFGMLGDTNKLKHAFEEAGGKKDGKVDSCMQTQRVLGLALAEITGNNPVPIKGSMAQYNQGQCVQMIGELLRSRPKAVFIDVAPDHHFAVLSVSPTQVVIMQSYEGSYDFLEWSRCEGAGYRKLSTFIDDLNDLVSLNKVTNSNAAVRLFGFGGHINTVRNIYLTSDAPSVILNFFSMDL